MMIKWFVKRLFILLLIAAALPSCAQHNVIASSGSYTDANAFLAMKQDILRLINQHRKSIGLGALQMLPVASEQADKHSLDMAKKRTPFGHDGFNQRMQQISKQTGRLSAAAENVAYGDQTAKGVVNGWLNSPGHKKNIEGNYNLTGIGIGKNASGTIFFTQIFLRK